MGSLYKAGREVKAGKEDLLSIVPLVWFKFCLLVFVLMEIEIVRQWAEVVIRFNRSVRLASCFKCGMKPGIEK
jgi:hypothetical protein